MPRTNTPKKATKRTRKEPTARASAVTVMEFMNSGTVPDVLSNVVQETVDRLCGHLDPHRPFKLTYEPEYEKHDMDLLTAVCKRSRLLKLTLPDLEKTEASLARHILAIMNHPKTPAALYNTVGDFITSATCIRDSSGKSLLDRWTNSPETVTAAVKWANEADDNEEMAEEVLAKVNARLGKEAQQ